MIEHILIPLDGSSLAECVLPHGLAVAKALNARATVLQVVEQAKAAGRTSAVDLLEWHYSEAQAGAYLQEVAERLRAAGLPATQALLQGDPAERVIDHAQAEHADLILLSSHGRSGLSGWNVSSVVQKILARAYIRFCSSRLTIRRRRRSARCAMSASWSRWTDRRGPNASCRWRGRWPRSTPRRSS